jgi:hypothetical protein
MQIVLSNSRHKVGAEEPDSSVTGAGGCLDAIAKREWTDLGFCESISAFMALSVRRSNRGSRATQEAHDLLEFH